MMRAHENITASNIGQLIKKKRPGWAFRSIDVWPVGFSGDASRCQMLQELMGRVGANVDRLQIYCHLNSGDSFEAMNAIMSSDGGVGSATLRSWPRLKRLGLAISGSSPFSERTTSLFLSALFVMPALQELKINGGSFSSSPQAMEQFLTGTTTLKSLELVCVSATTEFALAFRQGLQRNQSIRKMGIYCSRDGPFLRACLMGAMGNNHVRELSLSLESTEYSDQTLAAVRALVSGTKSIQKIDLRGVLAPIIEIYLGLASNSSVQDLKLTGVGRGASMEDDPQLDSRLARAIQAFSATNRTLQVFDINGNSTGRLGPLSRVALSNGLLQINSLREVKANGPVFSPDIFLPHVAKFQSVCLDFDGRNPDWRVWNMYGGNTLQVLDLSRNELTMQNLQAILPSLPRAISELRLKDCRIQFESVQLLCEFIESSQVKKIDLGYNPIGAQGAGSIFEAVSTSASMERLAMNGPMEEEYDDECIINLNECHGSILTLLVASRLVHLDLRQYGCELGRECMHALAAGLRQSETVKCIKFPRLNLEFIGVIGEALTINRSVESISTYMALEYDEFEEDGPVYLEELGVTEEESMLSFISMLPRMKSLARIDGLFDFCSTKKIRQALVAALKQNTWLKEIKGAVEEAECGEHVCHKKAVQFYLELNRLGRHHYVAAAPENEPIPVAVLPHLFARLADGPGHTSHLYYFLRHTSPDLLVGPGAIQRKCKPQAPHID